MSDRQLYRLVDKCRWCGLAENEVDADGPCFSGAPHDWYEKVEPCVHGQYDRHPIYPIADIDNEETWVWCPGAGIGGEDE